MTEINIDMALKEEKTQKAEKTNIDKLKYHAI